jgi:cytochrome c oxidase cbb3-type subunit 3
MLSLRRRDVPQTYLPADRIAGLDTELHRKEMNPEALWNRYCTACHGSGTYGTYDRFFNRFMPAVRGPGLRAVADETYLRAALEQGRPGTLMPAWHKSAGGLTGEQINALIRYLKDGDGRPPQALRPAPAALPGDAARGAELFTQACAGCHGGNRLAPDLANSVFQKTATDDFLLRTIANGRADTAMPAFRRDGADGLTDEELYDLLAYLRSLAK